MKKVIIEVRTHVLLTIVCAAIVWDEILIDSLGLISAMILAVYAVQRDVAISHAHKMSDLAQETIDVAMQVQERVARDRQMRDHEMN